MKEIAAVLVASLLASLGVAGPTKAEEALPGTGALEARGPDGKALGACPLKHTDVSAEVAGFAARVVVTQRFENPHPDPIEAVYTFPLPEQAAVDAMRIRAGEREIRGEIQRRERAREIYEEAKASGRLAALLDQERPNVFTQAIANLMPGEAVEVVIEYVEPLRYEAGTFELVFPTVVGPRFVPPGGRVPDASRITPPVTPEGTRAGHDLSIAVELRAGVPIRAIESAVHEIAVERTGEDRARVRLKRRSEIPNRDFVLRWAVASARVESGWLAHRTNGDGYLTLVLLPPERVTAREAAPRELVFVIDRSGSQSGAPLLKAKETMLWIIERLNPQDTFQIVSFSSRAELLFAEPQPVTPDTRRRARATIDALEANGGTMMAEAIRKVAETRAEANRLRIVTFMTDGYVGNDFEVIDLVRRLRGTSRWFPFGTGQAVNRFLIDGMARYGGGEAEYVLLDASGEEVASEFYERIASPVLTDVSLEFEGLDVSDVYPSALSDVWAERPLVVQARYRGEGKGRVVLRGYRGGAPWRRELALELPRREEANGATASLWARAKVDDLMGRDLGALQSGGFPEDLKERIVEVALAHRLVTQFTSFVAVEDRVVNEGGRVRAVSVPVEMPQGVRYEGVFGDKVADEMHAGLAYKSAAPMAAPAHRRIVSTAQRVNAGREAEEADAPAPLDAAARARLAPALLALLEGRADAATLRLVVDGRIEVRVTLARGAPRSEALRRLREAGLKVSVVGASEIAGGIALEDLAALARLDCVERIELP